VPTSLWVESRIICAKQFIFDKEVGNAIQVLREIAYILPPFPVEGLSYLQDGEAKLEAFITPNKDNIVSPDVKLATMGSGSSNK